MNDPYSSPYAPKPSAQVGGVVELAAFFHLVHDCTSGSRLGARAQGGDGGHPAAVPPRQR
jgi:hypothetical protein